MDWTEVHCFLWTSKSLVSRANQTRRRKQPKATQRWYTILSMNWNTNKTKKKEKLFKRSKRISVFLMKLMSTYCIKQLVQSVRIWCWQEILLPSLLSCICRMTAGMVMFSVFVHVHVLVGQLKEKLTLLGWGSAFGLTIWVPGGIMPLGGSLTSTSKPASKWFKKDLQLNFVNSQEIYCLHINFMLLWGKT